MNEVKFKNRTKLSDVIEFLPNGIINKSVTGIGATHLEATCKRHSIIVEPTRAIVEDKSRKHECLGFMGGMGTEEVEEYLNTFQGDFKKIFVVSDSVHKLITIMKELGEDVFNEYHYLLDEAEQYQTEAGYRVGMGIAIDYFKIFPANKRTVLSAFLYKFSNPILAAEPKIKYGYEVPEKRNIDLIVTGNPILEAISTIKQLSGNNLIFVNSIEIIINIIHLGGFPVEECSVFCGEGSVDKVKEYYKPFTNTPTSKYNFYTSAYFSGVDIIGDYNVLSLVDVTKIHTLLYPSKLKQIHGRVRMQVLKDIVISSFSPALSIDYAKYVELRLKDAMEAIEIIKVNEGLAHNKWFNSIKQGIIKQEFDGVLITREDKDGNVVPNYEEIDCKYLNLKVGTELYSTEAGLKNYLIHEGHNVSFTKSEHSFSQLDIEKMNSYRDKIDAERKLATEYVYNYIKKEEAKGLFNIASIDFRQLMYQSTGTARRLFKFYMDFKDLEALKKSEGNEKYINQYKITYSFNKLNENHTFKHKLNSIFKPNEKFTSTQIAEKLNETYTHILPGAPVLSERAAVRQLRRFYKLSRCKMPITRVDGWRII